MSITNGIVKSKINDKLGYFDVEIVCILSWIQVFSVHIFIVYLNLFHNLLVLQVLVASKQYLNKAMERELVVLF